MADANQKQRPLQGFINRLFPFNGLFFNTSPFWKTVPSILKVDSSAAPSASAPTSSRPLLDLEDVRAFVRSVIAPRRKPPRCANSDYIPRASVSYFDIKSVDTSLPSTVRECSHSTSQGSEDVNDGEDNEDDGPVPLLDIEDVREAVQKVLRLFARGPPSTSWRNKMPWLKPGPPFFASFESVEQRREYYRQERKRGRIMMASPPLWTVHAFNLAFLAFLMWNPIGRYIRFLSKF